MQLIKYYIIWLQENVCVIELNLKLTYVQLLIILLLHTIQMATTGLRLTTRQWRVCSQIWRVKIA